MKSRLPLLLALIGVILRIFPAWAMPMWYDENFTLLVARLPIPQLIQATAGDVHPPLWYLIIWPLAHIPALPAWLVVRLPSMLAGIACIWIWWKILEIMTWPQWTREWINKFESNPNIMPVRLVAFGLFCLLPQQIYYSQEGRMYALLTLLVLLAWYFILTHRLVWLAITASAMLWLQNYGLIYLVALWVAALVYDRRTWKPVTIALGAAGISFIPWVMVMLGQMQGITGHYWIERLSIPSILATLTHTVFAIAYINFDMLSIAVFWGVLTWMLIWSIRHRTLNLPAAILAFLPLALAAVISFAWQPILLLRALIPSGAFICLILVEPLEYLGRKPVMLLSIFFIPVLLVNLANTEVRSGWASKSIQSGTDAITYIDSHWQPGDLLYYVDDGVFVSGAVSWKHIDNILQAPPCGPVAGGLSQQTKDTLGLRTGPLPKKISGRTWVISTETPLNPSCLEDYLRANVLLDGSPLFCPQENELVKSCLYLVER
jgi:hypothetical protein